MVGEAEVPDTAAFPPYSGTSEHDLPMANLRKVVLSPKVRNIPLEDGRNDAYKSVDGSPNWQSSLTATHNTNPTPPQKERLPLALAPQNCAIVQHYADLYKVKDVKSWVHKNCAFAKMYLPNATCEEIDALVGSCYSNQ